MPHTDSSRSSVRLLVLSDIHIRATGESFPVEDLPVSEYDAVVSLGDVVDDNTDHAPSVAAGEPYERRGREFFAALDEQSVPVLAVPGNHDPVSCTERLTAAFDHVSVLHTDSETLSAASSQCSVVGWGCEQFDFTPAFLTPEYPAPDIGTDNQSAPDQVATTLVRAAGRFLAGTATESDLTSALDISGEGARRHFEDSLATLQTRFDEITTAMADAESPVVLASHISPFGVPYDRRSAHSHEGQYHFGSLALRLAVAATGPAACLSAHTHQEGMTTIETTDGHTYAYNPGDTGVASVTVHGDGGVVVDGLDIC